MLALPRPPLRLALAALILAAALPRAHAAEGALEFFHGPDQSEWLTLRVLEVRLDGQPLAVPLPAGGHDPAKVLLRQALPTGAHRLDVLTALDGDSNLFTYVEGTRFTMRGVLQLDVVPGDVVEVRTRVLTQEGVTLKWEDRYRLSLEATVRRSLQPEVAAVQVEPAPAAPAPAPAPSAAPAPAVVAPAAPAPAPAVAKAPASAPPRASAPAGACAMAPIRFAFDKSTLSPEAETALDGLAACLAASGRAVRIEGHCDGQGPDLYNEWLGAQRAAAAARRLRERGVAPARITVRSMSAGSPACVAAVAACYAQNRRVEAVVLE